VIVASGPPSTFAAKAATTSIPIVFGVGADPVQLGLVASLNRPGGNLTGFNVQGGELGVKELALLHELVPSAAIIGFLGNPNDPISELMTRDVVAAAPVVGIKVQILKASSDREIDAAFVSLVQARTGALRAVPNTLATVAPASIAIVDGDGSPHVSPWRSFRPRRGRRAIKSRKKSPDAPIQACPTCAVPHRAARAAAGTSGR